MAIDLSGLVEISWLGILLLLGLGISILSLKLKIADVFLLIVLGLALSLCWIFIGFIIKNAFADVQNIKTIAWSAKNLSESNQSDIVDLKANISQIQVSQETFRKEYREDQKDLDRKLGELLRAVRS
mgnify:CR=1 FL=1